MCQIQACSSHQVTPLLFPLSKSAGFPHSSATRSSASHNSKAVNTAALLRRSYVVTHSFISCSSVRLLPDTCLLSLVLALAHTHLWGEYTQGLVLLLSGGETAFNYLKNPSVWVLCILVTHNWVPRPGTCNLSFLFKSNLLSFS